MEKNSLNNFLNFAREKEEEAAHFYITCADLTDRVQMKNVFLEMAEEEKKHAEMIDNLDSVKIEDISIKEVQDLKIGDYLVEEEFRTDMSYQELLILAIKREEKAYKMYMELSERGDSQMKKLFLFLANEESRHKNRLELEYDDVYLKKN